MDTSKITLALRDVRRLSYIQSFLIERNGYLVTEEYFTIGGKYTNADLASMSKNITSALVGIALREKYIDSLGQKMLDFFPEYVTPSMDRRKRDITLEHLLTMKSGFDFIELADHSSIFNANTNWIRETINLSLLYNPGQTFSYATPNVHLLSGILTKASHMSTLDLANKFLFKPLNISVLYWPKDPQGYYLGGTGIILYPRDLARFGCVYLNSGQVDNQPILPSEWVKQSIQPHVDLGSTWGDIKNVSYGYLWWVGTWNNDSLFIALGFGGQFIIGDPRLNLVIVVTSDVNCTAAESDARYTAILDIVTKNVLPAAH